MVTIKAFGDESADGPKKLVFAVAAVLGTEDEWGLAIREWLMRTRGRPFHANKCESEFVKDADPQKHEDNLKLYFDLTQILARSYLVGFAVALDLKAYHEIFIAAPHPDWAYFKALADVISATATTAKTFNARPEEPDDVRLEFTFDSRLESNGTAGTMYTMLANRPDWADAGIFDATIVFEGGAGKSPRLEIADLLARESMKEVERRVARPGASVRGARRALDETKKFHFIEHDREYWERLRDMVQKPESAELMREFDEWLLRSRKVQQGQPARSMANWFLFNAWLDRRDAISEIPSEVP